ncbi:unnamed protein product [Urochloa humidicola]
MQKILCLHRRLERKFTHTVRIIYPPSTALDVLAAWQTWRIRVTIHHCCFYGTVQRHPRLRFGKVHLYNNYTRSWGIYAVCAGAEAQIVSQCNIYEAGVGPPKKTTVFKYMPEKAADREDVVSGVVRSEGDAFLNGALPCLMDGPAAAQEAVFRPEDYYRHWTMEPASPVLKDIIQLCAGWQPVPRPPDDC